ncbi:uncharacterized protein LOC5512861 [Nematostella vectensis]|nr:uncharacterized protein LOC5512861 [Nematostella vectensis]
MNIYLLHVQEHMYVDYKKDLMRGKITMRSSSLGSASAVFLACGILLLLSHAQADQCTGNNLSISMKSRLECGIFQTVLTNRTGCIRTCLTTLKCFSLNFYQSLTNGSEICELVDDVQKNKVPGCMKKHHGDHTEIEDYKPCHPLRKCKIFTRKALDGNWYQLGSKKFKAFSKQKTWEKARAACVGIGASLASVTNEIESQLIGQVLLSLIKDDRKIDVKETFSPMAYWKLDGTDPLSSGLRLVGDVKYVQDEDTKTTVLHFPGTPGDYATTPRYDFSSISVTIAMWVKVLEMEYMYFYSYWKPYTFRFVMSRQGTLEFTLFGNQDNGVTSGGSLIQNKWHFIAGVWNKDTLNASIFIDGVKVKQQNMAGKSVQSSADVTEYFIGWKKDSETPIYARLAHLMLFDKALSTEKLKLVEEATVGKKAGKEVWLGLNDKTTEGNFFWQDSEPASYQNFAPGHPNSPGDDTDCVVARDSDEGKWADTKCDAKRPYICMKPA